MDSPPREEVPEAVLEEYDDIPFDFLDRYLGGTPLVIDCSIVHNGMYLSAKTLLDTGANAFILVNIDLAAKIQARLQGRPIDGFRPHPVAGFDGKAVQYIDRAVIAHLRVQGRIMRNVPFFIFEIKHEMIIGRKFFDVYDFPVDFRRGRLVFLDTWPREYHVPEISRNKSN